MKFTINLYKKLILKTKSMKTENFSKFIDLVYAKAPLQKKKLDKYLTGQDEMFFLEAEDFAKQYIKYLNDHNISLEYAVTAYLKMCNDFMKCQISFMKTGSYPVQLSGEAFDNFSVSKYFESISIKSAFSSLSLFSLEFASIIIPLSLVISSSRV